MPKSRVAFGLSKKGKVAVGLAVSTAAGAAVFLFAKLAKASDDAATEMVKLRNEAAGAAQAAQAANAAAQAAAGREAAARAAADRAAAGRASAEGYAANAGQQAAAAMTAAQAAAEQATGLATAARAEADAVRRTALEREAALRAGYAQQLAQQAAQARAAAQAAANAAAAQARAEAQAQSEAARAGDAKAAAASEVASQIAVAQAAQVAAAQVAAAEAARVQEAQARQAAEARAIAATNEARAQAELARQQQEQARANAAQVTATQQQVATVAAGAEAKRQVVSAAFQQVLAAVKAAKPGLSQQQAINEAAKLLTSKGIELDSNKATPFWNQPEAALRAKVVDAVNMSIASLTAKPAPAAPKPAKVTTAVDPAKIKVVQTAYAAAIAYAIDRNKVSANKTLSAQQAYDLIAGPFRIASVPFPGGPVVPVPAELDSPVSYWAQSLPTIQKTMVTALAAAKRAVEGSLEVLALDPRNNYVLVKSNNLVRDAKGNLVQRTDPKTGKLLPTTSVSKALAGSGFAYGLQRPSAYGWN